jgi:hypothetical protein
LQTLNLNRCTVSIGAVAILLAGCGTSQFSAPAAPRAAAPLQHQATFRFAGHEQTFVVPHGVTHIRVIAVGGNGGGDIVARGGGYYGGGGGGAGISDYTVGFGGGGGAGGGASYVESTATEVQMWRGWKQDQGGIVVLQW